MIKVGRMLKRHLDNLVTWFRHPISNGPVEGFNSHIQGIKSAARSFRNFADYCLHILFVCGSLNREPAMSFA